MMLPTIRSDKKNSTQVLPRSTDQYLQRKAIISGVEYVVTSDMYRLMLFFAQSEAISPTLTHVIDCISTQVWELIIQLLEDVNYSPAQPPPKIFTNNARDYMQERLVQRLDCTPLRLLNQIYIGCHFLKLNALKRCLSVYLVCKVYLKFSSNNYQALMGQLNVTNHLDSQKCQEYLERFPFIN